MASSKHLPTAEVISTKPKKDKKERKEKSSKKRKAELLKEPSEPNTSTSPQPPVTTPVEAEDLIPSTSADTTVQRTEDIPNGPPAKKRKAVVEEIEVDITAPEPPSKKALRLLKKGKTLPPSKSGAESTPEPDPKKAKLEKEKKSEHGIWIGNLPFFVSKTHLREFFVSKLDDVTEEMITRVHMPGPNDGKPANKVEQKRDGKTVHNKGFAYVDFESPEAVNSAVGLSEQLLGGRRVLIKDNKSFEGRPLKTKEESRKEGKPPSKKIFLGNLPFDATEESVREHFEKCGTISSIKMATFEDSGKCKGYAWVVFEELEAAASAVRGFLLVEELDSDVSESGEDTDASDESKSENAVSKSKPNKTKKRKVWVNRIRGRPLRMEFAEDDQTRYSKRYKKEGTKKDSNQTSDQPTEAFKDNVIVPKAVEYRQPYAPRLTGGIVESKGKKVTF